MMSPTDEHQVELPSRVGQPRGAGAMVEAVEQRLRRRRRLQAVVLPILVVLTAVGGWASLDQLRRPANVEVVSGSAQPDPDEACPEGVDTMDRRHAAAVLAGTAILAGGRGSGASGDPPPVALPQEPGAKLAVTGGHEGELFLPDGSYGVLGASGRLEAVFRDELTKVVLLGVPPEEPGTPSEFTVSLVIRPDVADGVARIGAASDRAWLANDGECTVTFEELPPGDIGGSITCGSVSGPSGGPLESLTGTFRAAERSG